MADPNKPAPLFLIYNQAGGFAGPQHRQYFLALDAAVTGGWKPARELAEYAKHQNVVHSQEAASLAEGLRERDQMALGTSSRLR